MSKTHIPAWRRLGLKLKYAKDPVSSSSDAIEEPPLKKCRVEKKKRPGGAEYGMKGNGSASNDTVEAPRKLRKQVSFTADTKSTDGDSAVSLIPSEEVESISQPKSSARQPNKTKQRTQPAATKPNRALEYLTEYYRSHPTWKFNKNREVWILKNALSSDSIPPAYNPLLAQYIYGLKSQNTRDRLRLQCFTVPSESQNGLSQVDLLVQTHGKDALANFPAKTIPEGTDLHRALCDMSRTLLVRWAIDPAGTSVDSAVTERKLLQPQDKKVASQKKRKNRTAVVDYSSSSDSSSSESDDTLSSDSSESGSSSSED